MPRTKKVSRAKQGPETDSWFILKLVTYLILGALWLRVIPFGSVQIPIPIGVLVGLGLASHDRFMIDRKIEYGVLIVAMFVGFWLPIGLSIEI